MVGEYIRFGEGNLIKLGAMFFWFLWALAFFGGRYDKVSAKQNCAYIPFRFPFSFNIPSKNEGERLSDAVYRSKFDVLRIPFWFV